MRARIWGFFNNQDFEEEPVNQRGYCHYSDPGLSLWSFATLYNQMEIASGTDDPVAESLALLYRKKGIRGFRQLNGKFTIIIREADKTIIIRDRNGEGRVIYYTGSHFSDSYQKILNLSGNGIRPSPESLKAFLAYGYIPSPYTALEGVFRIPAGGVLTVSASGAVLDDLFCFDEVLQLRREPMQPEEAMEVYSGLVKQSLLRRVGNSVSAGVLLSGGLDSGGNLSLLREIFSGKIHTFTVGFRNNPANEADQARLLAEKFGTEHHEYMITGKEIENLPLIIDALGDPFAESGVMLNFAALRMFQDHDLPVLIGGDANDQYFGAGIRETALHYQLQRYGFLPFMRMMDTLSECSLFNRDNLLFRLRYQNRKILRVMEPERFGFYDFQLKRMFGENDPGVPFYRGSFGSYEELFLKRNYYLHLCQTTNDVIINKAARLSDHLGIHLAFTYTDLDLWNFIQHLPLNLRASGSIRDTMLGRGVSKYLHKQLMRSRLPAEVTGRSKQGGFSPLELFFRLDAQRKQIYRYILRSDFAATLADKRFLLKFFGQFDQMMEKKPYWFWYRQVKSGQLFNLLVLVLWWDRLLLNKKSEMLSDYLSDAVVPEGKTVFQE